MRELLFSQPREKTNILVETRIAFLGRELLLGKSTKNSLNLWQTRITQRNVILVGIVWESLILVWFLDENYIKPRRELSFSLLENDNSRLNIVILPLIRGENHVIRGTITVSPDLLCLALPPLPFLAASKTPPVPDTYHPHSSLLLTCPQPKSGKIYPATSTVQVAIKVCDNKNGIRDACSTVDSCPLLLSTADIIDCLKMALSLQLFKYCSVCSEAILW